MIQTILAEYEQRKAAAAGAYKCAKKNGDRYRLAVFAAAFFTLRWIWVAIQRVHDVWLAAAMAAITIGLLALMRRERRQGTRAWRLALLYERGLERVSGRDRWSGLTGERLTEPGHLYERDLDVLGKDSLFDLLATTRTVVGQRGLARLLLRTACSDVAQQRQEAVRELSGLLDLRERVAMVGRYKFEDVPVESFERWLDTDRSSFDAWVRWALLLLTVAWIGVGIVGLLAHVDWTLLLRELAVPIAAQGALCLWLQKRVRAELEAAQPLIGQMSILREGLSVMREGSFAAERLQALQSEVQGEDHALAQLERYLMVVEQRPKEWFYPLSLLFCMGTQAAISLDEWKRQFDGAMRRWLDVWAEFEALLALGTYAAEHAENTYPEIVDSERPAAAIFNAEGMTHPLLWRGDAVANDVAIGGGAQFLLISGSNMAGKSTLLRTIGANVVLGLAGAPVPARAMKISALRIGASLAVSDSLAEGKSKFLAEVERLRDLLALATESPGRCLFLIDEVFSGTNSIDRRVAAEAVLRGLLATGAIGALSTHDLALAELAEIAALGGRNVHMASPDEADPLAFDYLLKSGVNRTTNALAIVRLLGLSGLELPPQQG